MDAKLIQILYPILLLALLAGCGSDDSDQDTDGDLSATDGDVVFNNDGQADGDYDHDAAEDDVFDPNGIYFDPATGFEWQVVPAEDYMSRSAGINFCLNLAFAGGGWRLPNISELRTLVRGCPEIEIDGACGVKDVCPDCGVAADDVCLEVSVCEDSQVCNPESCPESHTAEGCYWPEELEGECYDYISASPSDEMANTWYLIYSQAIVSQADGPGRVRCVRGCSEENIISHTFRACHTNNVYWFDSCGNPEEMIQDCGTSSQVGELYCYGGDVYRDYDVRACRENTCSVNHEKERMEECGNSGCDNGVCLNR